VSAGEDYTSLKMERSPRGSSARVERTRRSTLQGASQQSCGLLQQGWPRRSGRQQSDTRQFVATGNRCLISDLHAEIANTPCIFQLAAERHLRCRAAIMTGAAGLGFPEGKTACVQL
jgi:hypothetical protein